MDLLTLKNASQIRRHIESALSSRIPSALTPVVRTAHVRIACGDQAIDELLGGGLPVGGLSELVGAECSGRTTMALSYLRAITHAECVCAWIDVADALDPETAAANGVDLDQLLWVRCGTSPKAAIPILEPLPGSPPVVNTSVATYARHTGGGSPHPRSEGRDMPQAITAMLQAHGGLYQKQLRREMRSVGTPGAVNRRLSQASNDREEQVPTDRLPARREHTIAPHKFAVRYAEPQPKHLPHLPLQTLASTTTQSVLAGTARYASKPWQALDQALRATDLLLQGGGFSAIVLDLGSTPAEFALRIPLATWFRFRAACERTGGSLLVLTQYSCSRSAAELVVRMQTGSTESAGKVMTAMRYEAALERQRFSNPADLLPFIKPLIRNMRRERSRVNGKAKQHGPRQDE